MGLTRGNSDGVGGKPPNSQTAPDCSPGTGTPRHRRRQNIGPAARRAHRDTAELA